MIMEFLLYYTIWLHLSPKFLMGGQFIEKVKEKLGFRAIGRKVNDAGAASFQLREAQSTYGDDCANIDLLTENTFR